LKYISLEDFIGTRSDKIFSGFAGVYRQ